MQAVFLRILNMSLSAAAVIAVVTLTRFLLRPVPKKWSYLLWGVVGFRLCCPVSLKTEVSIFRLAPAQRTAAAVPDGPMVYISPVTGVPARADPGGLPIQTSPAASGVVPVSGTVASAAPLPDWIQICTIVWCVVLAALLIYGVVSYLILRWRLSDAVWLWDEAGAEVYETDRIRSPFIMGLFRPRIYLPCGLEEESLRYVLAHERYHIKRRDHLVKVLAYVLLAAHWFNPLVWLAFCLMSRDMEMSCDEKVLAGNTGIAKSYSRVLLSFAVEPHFPSPSPLAFGETNTKRRIKNVLNWKRPKLWVSVAAATLFLLVIAACGTDPALNGENEAALPTNTGESGAYRGEAIQAYLDSLMEELSETGVTYFSSAGGERVAPLVDHVITEMRQTGSLSGLSEQGLLESWAYGYAVKVDAEDVTLVGGMSEQDGWYDLEGHGGHDVVALRYADGSYDILYDNQVNDNMQFYGYHNSYEEAIYDWYVSEYGLDLPLYVMDWRDKLRGWTGNYPVHRFDGDGWYVYIPVFTWEQAADQYRWDSLYNTGSHLIIREASREELEAETPQPAEGQHQKFCETPEGRYWSVFTEYIPENLAGNPEQAIEARVLELMADSFTIQPVSVSRGSTMVFSYKDWAKGSGQLSLEVTQVLQVGNGSLPAGGTVDGEWEFPVYICSLTSMVSVRSAFMSDPAASSDGQAHAQWVLCTKEGLADAEGIDVVDGLSYVPVIEDLYLCDKASGRPILKLERTTGDVPALINEALTSDGAYSAFVLDRLLERLVDHPQEVLDTIGSLEEDERDWLCWSLADYLDGLELDTDDALFTADLSENGKAARDKLIQYLAEPGEPPQRASGMI